MSVSECSNIIAGDTKVIDLRTVVRGHVVASTPTIGAHMSIAESPRLPTGSRVP